MDNKDMKQAGMFEYFYALGPDRNVRLVANHFGVSDKTVRRYAKEFDWKSQIEQRDSKAIEAIKAAGDEGAILTRLEFAQMHTVLMRKAYQLLVNDKIKIRSVADFERIGKLTAEALNMIDPDNEVEKSGNMASLAEAIASLEIAPPEEEEEEEKLH